VLGEKEEGKRGERRRRKERKKCRRELNKGK
jgi:hypothetical protein